MYVHTSELSALTTILRSVGPVISTRRSTRPGAGSAPRHVGSSRMCLVSGRKSGSTPLSISAWRSTRRSSSWRRVSSKVRCRVARNAHASLVKILLLAGLIAPRTLTPLRIESVWVEDILSVLLFLFLFCLCFCFCFYFIFISYREAWEDACVRLEISISSGQSRGFYTRSGFACDGPTKARDPSSGGVMLHLAKTAQHPSGR